jgi:2-methylcitrate dehydratase PrpD
MNADDNLGAAALAQQGNVGAEALAGQGDGEAEALVQQDSDRISRNPLWRGSQEDMIIEDVRRLWW